MDDKSVNKYAKGGGVVEFSGSIIWVLLINPLMVQMLENIWVNFYKNHLNTMMEIYFIYVRLVDALMLGL